MQDGTKLQARHFRITTQCADPRRLFVRLENDSLILHFIVLHAPCLGKNKGDGTRPIDQISDWWRETTLIFFFFCISCHGRSCLGFCRCQCSSQLRILSTCRLRWSRAPEPSGTVARQFFAGVLVICPIHFCTFPSRNARNLDTLKWVQIPKRLCSHQQSCF